MRMASAYPGKDLKIAIQNERTSNSAMPGLDASPARWPETGLV